MSVVVAVLLALVVIGQLVPFAYDRLVPNALQRRYRRTVIVTTKPGPSFRGVLIDCDSTAIVLRNSEMLPGPTAAPVIVDGELILLRSDIAYMQRP